MKNRTVTNRNVTGAFLGGVAGILACARIHPLMLPVGVCLGVIVGWWYQEIWRTAQKTRQESLAWSRRTLGALDDVLAGPKRVLMTNIDDDLLKAARFVTYPFLLVFRGVTWVLSLPVRFVRWLSEHPVNQAQALRALAAGVSLAITWKWVKPVARLSWFGHLLQHDSPLVLLALPLIAALLMPLLASVIYLDAAHDALKKNMTAFYREWERIASFGRSVFFFREVVVITLAQMGFTIFFVGTLFWFLGVGLAVIVFAVAPIAFAIGLINGIYEAATKAGHYLCLAATLVTTTFVAWKTHHLFGNTYVLWTIALVAGSASALATEALRRSLLLLLSRNKWVQGDAFDVLDAQLAPIGRIYWRMTGALADKFGNMFGSALDRM